MATNSLMASDVKEKTKNHPEREDRETFDNVNIRQKKKLRDDDMKQRHDQYNEETQAPKSREELIDLYGYDIRAAENPSFTIWKGIGR